VQILDDDLAMLGLMQIHSWQVPVYLARHLGAAKTFSRLDLLLRGRHDARIGIVLTTGEKLPHYLGANVVISLKGTLLYGDKTAVVSRDGIVFAYSAGRSLAMGGSAAAVLKYGTQSGTLHLPGKPALSLVGANQIRLFERLVEAQNAGSPDVKASGLLEGSSCRSPQQAFRPENWRRIVNVYIAKGAKHGFWRIPE
jgi:hypothetical protein